MNTYSVAPFSMWKKSSSKVVGITGCECAICGKPVKTPFKHIAVVIDGGARWATTEAEININDPGYMGEHPIWPDCHKKYRLIEGRDQ